MENPAMKSFFRPYISANRPKGTDNIAAASRKDVAIQFNDTAFILKSLAIEGIAMFTPDAMNGNKNEAIEITTKTVLLSISSLSAPEPFLLFITYFFLRCDSLFFSSLRFLLKTIARHKSISILSPFQVKGCGHSSAFVKNSCSEYFYSMNTK